jgi:hypothetical protein
LQVMISRANANKWLYLLWDNPIKTVIFQKNATTQNYFLNDMYKRLIIIIIIIIIIILALICKMCCGDDSCLGKKFECVGLEIFILLIYI